MKKGPSKTYLLNLWSKIVRSETDGVCALCPSAWDVQAHHIIKRGYFVHVGWFLVDNGIPLCKVHHSGIHDLYFPRTQDVQSQIVKWLKKKKVNYDILFEKCKSRNYDLELSKIQLKQLISEVK